MGIRHLLKSFREQFVERSTALGLLAFASIHLIWSLCDYSGCFSEMEVYLTWFPSVLLNGKGFSFSDFSQAIDAWGMDGDSRPRFLSYYLAALTIKARIALWDWLPPHPSFSPMWPVTLVLAPWLLYRFLKEELECHWSAIVGASLYMLSAGYLSSATMLFHPGKPLANVAVIATLYVATKARNSLTAGVNVPVRIIPKTAILFYLVLLPILLLADETALFCLLILPVWAHRYIIPRRFKRKYLQPCLINSLLLSFPAAVYLAVVFVVAPLLSNNVLQRSYNFGDYLSRYLDFGKAGLISFVQHATTLFSATVIPWILLNRPVPVGEKAELPVGMFIIVLAIFFVFIALIYRDKTRRQLLFRLTTLVILFLLFQTFVAAHHPQSLTVTGYYYGAIFSVLVSALLATVYASLVRTSKGQAAAAVIVICLATNLSFNYSQFNSSWLKHRNYKGLQLITKAVYNPFFAQVDASQLLKLKSETPKGLYADDISAELRPDHPHWIAQLWSGRNAGKYKPQMQGHVLALEDLWVLYELYHWQTPPNITKDFSDDTSPSVALNSKLLQAYRGILSRADYRQGGSGEVPILAFQNIAIQNRVSNEYETKLVYPWICSSMECGIQYLRAFRYTHILVTNDMLLPDGNYSLFHNQFMREKHAVRLEKYGIFSRGSFVVNGHNVTLLEIVYFPSIT